ncbi:beta-ketoacyl synthase N-terminal-like domain-containing protein [Streptomyces sp. NPDC091292]|uniref:beta-ketoacyl synthase N-terminal-like domain-containing protein n=1 Tax=Streptomyces sp. NPDC091292 TaxID=3365991 RepID=UPI0037F8EC09
MTASPDPGTEPIPAPDATDIWVTGMAWTTALGSGLDEVWTALLEGRTGIGPARTEHRLRNTDAAVLAGLPMSMSPVQRQQALTRDTVAAAVRDAGLDLADPRLRPVLGTSYGPHMDVDTGVDVDMDTGAATDTDSLGVRRLDRWAVDAVRALGMVKDPLSVTTACSSGSDSLLVAMELIRSGAEDICVCGGADILTAAKRLGHSVLETMSPTSLRAFDTRHDGTILGEGAAFVVLESGRSARARHARAHGFLVGAGSANDAVSPAAPDASGESVVRAVTRALRAANRGAADVDVINAHGSGTPANDAVEALGYTRLFGAGPAAGRPTVFATKGAFGHTLGATGAIEAITVLLALRDGAVPPVHGLTRVRPDFALPVPVGGPAAFTGRLGLSTTLGFGGFNTCLVFEGATPEPTTPEALPPDPAPPRQAAREVPPEGAGMVAVGHGRAVRDELTVVRSRIPSLYADPLAWLVADAVEDALSGCADDVLAVREDVATILVSAECTLRTMEAVARSVPSGRVSPLRFAGASPGSAGSLVCLLHGFKGPSLTFSTTPEAGLSAAHTVARSWLRSGAASYVVLCAHEEPEGRRHLVQCSILAPHTRAASADRG